MEENPKKEDRRSGDQWPSPSMSLYKVVDISREHYLGLWEECARVALRKWDTWRYGRHTVFNHKN